MHEPSIFCEASCLQRKSPESNTMKMKANWSCVETEYDSRIGGKRDYQIDVLIFDLVEGDSLVAGHAEAESEAEAEVIREERKLMRWRNGTSLSSWGLGNDQAWESVCFYIYICVCESESESES